MVNGDEANKIYMAVVKGLPLDSTGLTGEKYESLYLEIQEDLAKAPKGVMAVPVDDWAGEEYSMVGTPTWDTLMRMMEASKPLWDSMAGTGLVWIGQIYVETDAKGLPTEYLPQDRYENRKNLPLNLSLIHI